MISLFLFFLGISVGLIFCFRIFTHFCCRCKGGGRMPKPEEVPDRGARSREAELMERKRARREGRPVV